MNEADFARIMSQDNGEGTSTGSEPILKLNISTYYDRTTGIGGVITNSTGKWVKGFVGLFHDVKNCHGPEAELHALYHGLLLLRDMDAQGADVYLQSEAAYEQLARLNNYFDESIIYDKCRELVAETGSILHFDLYESIHAEPADWMAKRAVTLDIEFETNDNPPMDMQDELDLPIGMLEQQDDID